MKPSSSRIWSDRILSALFLSFAVVQWNDPDGWMWMLMYGIMAAICLFRRSVDTRILDALTLIAVIFFLSYAPGLLRWVDDGMPSVVETMKAESPHIEIIREAGGIFICLVVLIYYRMTRKRWST